MIFTDDYNESIIVMLVFAARDETKLRQDDHLKERRMKYVQNFKERIKEVTIF